MNKQERVFAILLGVLLVGWMVYNYRTGVARAQARAAAPAEAGERAAAVPPAETALTAVPEAPQAEPEPAPAPAAPLEPEVPVELVGDEWAVVVSSHGAAVKQVTLNGFTSRPGKPGADNPPVTMAFDAAPALALTGLPGLAANASYGVSRDASGRSALFKAVTPQGLAVTRRIELAGAYQVKVTDTVRNAGESVVTLGTNGVRLGVLTRGVSKNETLSLDALPAALGAKVRYGDKDKETKGLFGGGGGGCGGAPSAAGMPAETQFQVYEPQSWVAIKSRFFVAGLFTAETNAGYTASLGRDTARPTYHLERLAATVQFPGRVLGQGEELTRTYTLYVGPKKLALLKELGNGMEAVMEFGTFAWFCELLVPTLNFFHRLIPNYGIAVILLTFLVRIIFWPLTHYSTKSMKRMQEIQPKLKEIQAKFKDNPQKLQQETWAIYRENKVNPMSSCLPMLVQIPVFIALFTVLRSAVELRYAPFLWIADLSEPENLFAGSVPLIGALNILPVLMAATMALQSYLTPSAGDPQQQKMMMIMMPVMMLFMFYSFPSALSLYWTVSQVLSIVQMLMMRRKTTQPGGTDGGGGADATLASRQQRRAASRAS